MNIVSYQILSHSSSDSSDAVVIIEEAIVFFSFYVSLTIVIGLFITIRTRETTFLLQSIGAS